MKTLIGPKPLYIRFDKTDGFIRVYDGTRYFVCFGPKKYAISNKIRIRIRIMLLEEKLVLHILFLIIMQKSRLIHMILCL